MAKYSVPGIRFTEIDNTIRSEADPGMGIGAIVMKSNKGPVNQRVVTKNYGEFTEIFGEPETLTDYGHFAAENYFANSMDSIYVSESIIVAVSSYSGKHYISLSPRIDFSK